MSRSSRQRRCLVPALLCLIFASRSIADDRADVAFFESKIRPVLIEKCYSCHSGRTTRPKGGLRLDSRAGVQRGGESGPLFDSKHVSESLLIKALKHADDVSPMPPKEKLPEAVIADFARWIERGVPDPRSTADSHPTRPSTDETWWSLKPLTLPAVPAARAGLSPIDAFVQARLRESGLRQNAEADRRTLIRRLSLDLIGLPPTPAEIDAFENDRRPDAYERLVDRLLASPHYGERWARHWMDAVHFAETHGHDQDRIRPNAWPYRDYLIASFNADTRYPRFVREQVAADVLYPDEPGLTVALGFLASGPWDESSLRDIREDTLDRAIGRYLDRDDMVTTTMQTFVGLTVGCARCHDHKFDPISQADYYSLQAVFAGVDRADRVYDADPALARRRRELAERHEALKRRDPKEMERLLDTDTQSRVTAWEARLGGPPPVWSVLEPDRFTSSGGATLTKQADASILSSGTRPAQETVTVVARSPLDRVTAVRLEVLPDEKLPSKGPGRNPNGNLHLTEFRLFKSATADPKSDARLAFRSASADFNQDGWGISAAIDDNERTAWGIYPNVGKPHQAVFELKEDVSGPTSLTFVLQQTYPADHPIGRFRLSVTNTPHPVRIQHLSDNLARIVATPARQRTADQQRELAHHVLLEQLEQEIASLPKPSLVYAAAFDFAPDGSHKPAGKPRPVQVLRRGDIRSPIATAVPGTLECVAGLPARFELAPDAPEGERRKALALWLTDHKNPLLWRSIVNRIWHLHFGRGIVSSPNDLGRMGSLPSHPELLDWLAYRFREEGGSIKQLHRWIVTSHTYRQSSANQEDAARLDADNRLLWRQNRRRVDAESTRDAILLVSGRLDRKMGGPSIREFELRPGVHVTPVVDYAKYRWTAPESGRRSVYRFLFRTLPDPFMTALDSADASQLVAVRDESLTALQSLTLLNDRFILSHARFLAERIASKSTEDQADELFRAVLGRSPSTDERSDWSAHIGKFGLASAARLLFNTSEFLFID